MLVWVVRFSNDVAVAESDMGIFLQSRRNIKNEIVHFSGIFRFIFRVRPNKSCFLFFVYFSAENLFSHSVVLLFRPKTENSFSVL